MVCFDLLSGGVCLVACLLWFGCDLGFGFVPCGGLVVGLIVLLVYFDFLLYGLHCLEVALLVFYDW